MKIMLTICALLMCIDSTLEVFILDDTQSILIEIVSEEQQEKQEDKDGASFTQKDKTAVGVYNFFTAFQNSNTFSFYSSNNIITTGFQSCLYRPPEA